MIKQISYVEAEGCETLQGDINMDCGEKGV